MKFKNIKNHIINSCKTRSFSFAFWIVFIFGSIFIGFLGKFISYVLGQFQYSDIKLGYLSIWGYVALSYLIFSIIYLYRKANTLSFAQSKAVGFLLGIYICLCLVSVWTTGSLSFLFLFGRLLFSLMLGGNIGLFLHSIGLYNMRLMGCIAELNF